MKKTISKILIVGLLVCNSGVSMAQRYVKYLVNKPQFQLYPDNTFFVPNWIIWYHSLLGIDSSRQIFYTDVYLPQGWKRIITNEKPSNFEIPFLFKNYLKKEAFSTNPEMKLIPEVLLTQERWEEMEVYCKLVDNAESETFVLYGTFGQRGIVTDKLVVRKQEKVLPAEVWSVAIVLKKTAQKNANVRSRVSAVFLPENKYLTERDWERYKLTLKKIEYLTGCSLISLLYEKQSPVIPGY